MAVGNRDSIDDFMMSGGVYPRMMANPADSTCYKQLSITCAVCAYQWTPTVASNDTVIACPQCGFDTPTGQ